MWRRLAPLKPYLWKYRAQFLFGALAVLLNNGVWVLFPQVLRRATDDLNTRVTHEKIYIYSALLLAIALTKGVFQYLTRWILIGISREIEFDLRNDLFRKLETLSYDYYQRTRTGDTMARATNDLNAVRMLLGPAIMYSANTIVFMAAALFFMVRISPKLTLFAVLPLPIATTLVQYFGRKIHERFERIQAMFSDISARAQENFSAARLIRAYTQEEAEIGLFEEANREYITRSLRLIRLMGMLWPTLEVLLGIAVVIVLWLGGREVILHQITIGDFTAYTTYMVQLTWPIIALGWVINLFMRGTASLERIQEILDEKPKITDAPDAQEHDLRGSIEFRGTSFSFGDSPVLHSINLQIPAGSSLAIVGPTGSGKTTLVNLIPRILEAELGTIFIDGRPVRDY
ncbi:MAG: ATP-binding cassette domain-containing protein, partial [Acidobacteriales bacterium]|nr:ATP-binding cassette domain-containing protein [Terriglobales bacterium]